jgi:low affinity Fe/Cu permease
LVGFVLRKVKFTRRKNRITIKHEEEEEGEKMLQKKPTKLLSAWRESQWALFLQMLW